MNRTEKSKVTSVPTALERFIVFSCYLILVTFVLYNEYCSGWSMVVRAVVINPTMIPFKIKPIKNQIIDIVRANLERGDKSP